MKMAGVDDLVVYMQTAVKYSSLYIVSLAKISLDLAAHTTWLKVPSESILSTVSLACAVVYVNLKVCFRFVFAFSRMIPLRGHFGSRALEPFAHAIPQYHQA